MEEEVPKFLAGTSSSVALVASIISHLSPGQNLLNLICGTGKFLTNDRNPQTASYLPETHNKVAQ